MSRGAPMDTPSTPPPDSPAPGRSKPALPPSAPASTGSRQPPPITPLPGNPSAGGAPGKTGPKPAATASATGNSHKAVAIYNQLFPPASPQRRYGPAVLAGIVLVLF